MTITSNEERSSEEFWGNLPDAFFSVNEFWHIMDLNIECEQALNMKRKDLLGKNLWVVFPKTEELMHSHEALQAMKGRLHTAYTQYCPLLECWFKIFIHPIQNGLTIHFEKLTAAQKYEIEDTDSQQHLSPLVNDTEDMIWSLDKNMKLLSGNESFFKAVKSVTGREVEKGDELYLFVEEVSRGNTWKSYYERVLKGENFRIVDISVIPQGKERYTETSFNPVLSMGEIIGATCIARDITMSKLNERVIQEQNRLLRQIAFMQAHELRNPLASIMGLVSLFDKDILASDFNGIIIDKIEILCIELDIIIRRIVAKTSELP